MKRKWIWGLAAVPVIIGFAFAQRLADKRPRLVARGVATSTLTVSPDGKKVLVNGNRIVNLGDGSQIIISGDVSSRSYFSPNGKKILQFNSERDTPQSEQSHNVLVLVNSNSGQRQGSFSFADILNVHGVWWNGDEIIAESPDQTLVFETRSLRLVHKQTQRRKNWYGFLCPDGHTIYWPSAGVAPEILEFADLNTGKILWSRTQVSSGNPLAFSPDGKTVLWPDDTRKGGVVALNTRTGKEKWRMHGPQSSVLALSPDESAIYEARPNGELWKWPR